MNPSTKQRLLDLLADQSGGERLDFDELRELDHLQGEHPEVDPASFENAAAAIHLAMLGEHLEPMPSHTCARVLEAADAFFAPPVRDLGDHAPTGDDGKALFAWGGWFAAAAVVLFMVLDRGSGGGPAFDDVLGAPDVVVAEWSGTEDPAATDVRGRVAWSDELQAGYMVFEGLLPNDPEEGQYQLWIFAPGHPEAHPVDGGVFDSNGGELRVPIDAKLAVNDPTLFAVTYERPGGVVVSQRERLILVATPQ